ncbi:unnamed protein product, partial [Prorocentrum cordatum]
GEQWQRALALLSEMRESKLKPTAIHLQRWDQRVREGRAVAAGSGAAEQDAGCDAGAGRRCFYMAEPPACQKGPVLSVPWGPLDSRWSPRNALRASPSSLEA